MAVIRANRSRRVTVQRVPAAKEDVCRRERESPVETILRLARGARTGARVRRARWRGVPNTLDAGNLRESCAPRLHRQNAAERPPKLDSAPGGADANHRLQPHDASEWIYEPR